MRKESMEQGFRFMADGNMEMAQKKFAQGVEIKGEYVVQILMVSSLPSAWRKSHFYAFLCAGSEADGIAN